jgi:hypothetical protein
MAYEYAWELNGLTKSNHNDLKNVIVGTRWTVIATDEYGNKGSFVGATPFKATDVNIDSFTDFTDLTEQQVLGWIQNEVSGSNGRGYWSHIYERIHSQIDAVRIEKVDVGWEAFPWTTGSISGSI